jgi:uncharacterized repeat protein (TIGR04042 family)
MPEINFSVRLPDGETMECYSPSTVVREHFHTGEIMPMNEFVQRSRVALTAASERVNAKFGFYCTSASAQLQEILERTRPYPENSTVEILSI